MDIKFKTVKVCVFDGKIKAVCYSWFGSNQTYFDTCRGINDYYYSDDQSHQEIKQCIVECYGRFNIDDLSNILQDTVQEVYVFDLDNEVFSIYRPNTAHKKLTPYDGFYFMYSLFGDDINPPVLYRAWSFKNYLNTFQMCLEYCELEDRKEELMAIAKGTTTGGIKYATEKSVFDALIQIKNIMCPDYRPKFDFYEGENVVAYNGTDDTFWAVNIDACGPAAFTIYFENIYMAEIASAYLNQAIKSMKPYKKTKAKESEGSSN